MLGQAQTNEIFVIKAEVDTLAGRLNEACAALNAAEDRGQAFAAAAGHAEQALLAKELEIARLIAELDERSTLSEAQANEIRSLKAEVEFITGRLDETFQALNTAEDGRDVLTVAVEEAERALSGKESELAGLAGELNEHSTLSEAQANEILGLKAEVEALTGRFDETSKALNMAEDQRHALATAAENAEWALSAKELEVARLIGELNVHSTLGEAQTNEIVSLKAEVETLTARLDEAGKALSAAKDGHYALTAAAENAERALSAKESELARFIGELNARSTRSETQTNEMLGLKAEVRHPDRAPGRGLQRTDCGGGSPPCADRRGGERRAGVVREGSGSRQAHRRVERALNVRRQTGEGACCTQGLRWRHQRAPRRSRQRIAGGGRPTRCRAART